ncbi:hypothetical protein [Clostridium thailandense]|uniref:hypothetical protein n=1 Tax=Clostridium thailandense TaxID=2794346 RepID=UPI003989A245
MKHYFYKTEFVEYKSGLTTYLNKKNKIVIRINNLHFNEHLKRIGEFYKKLQSYYDNYSLKVKKIIEQDGINLENINEILKFEMYLYNIVSVYQDDTIIEEGIDFEEYLECWIHYIDQDTILSYFDMKHDLDVLNNKKMFFDFFSEKPKLDKIM